MKKYYLMFFMIISVWCFGGCTEETDDEKSYSDGEYEIDYKDATSFEEALNDGENVKGKIVQFEVNDYKPDSALGINCWAGEHLNFISENELDVQTGDIVIGYVTKEPTKVLGSWKILYEVIEINPEDKTEEKVEQVKDSDDNVTVEKETTKEEEITTELETTSKVEIVTEIETTEIETTIKVEIKEEETTTEPETTSAPVSEYEKAYVRKMSNYSLYFMFDEDTKKVVSFGTNDTYVMKGTYSGTLSSGVTISWNDGWDETFKHSSGSKATLVDGNGFDWEYEVCDVNEAQDMLDDLK